MEEYTLSREGKDFVFALANARLSGHVFSEQTIGLLADVYYGKVVVDDSVAQVLAWHGIFLSEDW